MKKIMKIDETAFIDNSYLKSYIQAKISKLFDEYSVDNLDDIGCFVILEKSENHLFSVSEMEFVEVLEIGGKCYLHGVKIISDNYAEDTYLPVEVRKC